jgi:hypothetical protein
MEFKSLKNIETSFKQIRIIAIVFVVLCAGITGYALWNSYSFAEAQRQKIYVLDEGKSLMLALSQDLSQNRPVEAREHIKRFHELFFTLSPDKSAIESNINRALFLVDKSAFRYYQDMQEKGFSIVFSFSDEVVASGSNLDMSGVDARFPNLLFPTISVFKTSASWIELPLPTISFCRLFDRFNLKRQIATKRAYNTTTVINIFAIDLENGFIIFIV